MPNSTDNQMPAPDLAVALQIRRFRLAAVAEAWSWAGLLVAMAFKYLVVLNPIGVQIMGPIHGVLFVVYVLLAMQVAVTQRWTIGVTAIAIAAAFPPFCTVWFERWAMRTGRLGTTALTSPATPER